MNRKCNNTISETKYYLKDPIIKYTDLATNKKVLFSHDEYVLILYPHKKMRPNIPFLWLYPPFDDIRFYCGIRYDLKYDLMYDIYFHNTIAQMVNIYQEFCITDEDIGVKSIFLKLIPSFLREGIGNLVYVVQHRDLFPPLTVNSNTNIYYKYEDKNKRRMLYNEKIQNRNKKGVLFK